MSIEQVRYGLFEQADAVIILAAGPSINNNFDQIRSYQKKFPNNVVLACNYDFPIDAHYTVFIDTGRYKKFISTIRSKNVVICPTIYPTKKEKKKFNFLQFKWNAAIQPYEVSKYVVYKDGSTGHKLGNCGMACLYMSHFFKPSHVLIAGFDGPESDKTTVKHFNKITRKWTQKDVDRAEPKAVCIRTKIIPFLASKGINVHTFSNCRFWGVRDCVQVIDEKV